MKIKNYTLNYNKFITISIIIILLILLILFIVFLYKNNIKKIINEAFNNDSSVNKPEIPKVIYMCHKNIDDIKKYSENWKRLNPEYEIKLYDNELSEQFLLKEFSQLHCDIFKYIPDGPIKADFWRVCIIYKYGGLYVDADINPLIPLKDYIEKDVDFVTCISNFFKEEGRNTDLNPHFIMARPNDNDLLNCINKYIDYYNNKVEYSYWGWSIAILLKINNMPINKKSCIHYDENKKYQFLLETPDLENCEYNGIVVLKNRYDNYKDHNFIDNNTNSSIDNNNPNINSNNNIILPYDVVIVGCARDIEKYLENTKQKLQMLKSLFRNTKIIIYENDSIDKTLDILKDWERENFIQLITEKDVKGIRTERLANARNILYNEAMKHNFDLYIVIDLDNVIQDLSKESIISCFNLKEDWAMVGANQKDIYYDMFALRTFDDWMPFDFAKCTEIKKKTNNYCLSDRIKNIPQDTQPIEVISCFGGFGIYKRKYIDNCFYGYGFQLNNDNNEKVGFCEHVDFNKGIKNNGGKIYINPKLINY
jgi:hypothetical protein